LRRGDSAAIVLIAPSTFVMYADALVLTYVGSTTATLKQTAF